MNFDIYLCFALLLFVFLIKLPLSLTMTTNNKPTAIITGSSRGIGRGIAIQLSYTNKYKLCLLSRNINGLNETKKLCEEINGDAVVKCYQCNVADRTQLTNILQDIGANYGPLCVLINNSGVGDSGNALTADLDHWDKMLDVNLRAVTTATRICLPFLKQSALNNDNVSIINISSMAGTLRAIGPNKTMYSATKFGVVGFSESVFEDVKEFGIKVSCINPGFVDTKMVRDLKKAKTLRFNNMIKVSDIAKSVQYVLDCSKYCCPTQIFIRAQGNPIKSNL